jgi:hypothetical protein
VLSLKFCLGEKKPQWTPSVSMLWLAMATAALLPSGNPALLAPWRTAVAAPRAACIVAMEPRRPAEQAVPETPPSSGPARLPVPAVEQEVAATESHMGVMDLLRDYGVVALGFHFTVWLLTVATVFTAVSVTGGSLLASLPSWFPLDAEAGAGAGKVAITFGIVEAIGPARLALTVAATPTVSGVLRRFPLARLGIRRAERVIDAGIRAVTERLPGRRGGKPPVQDP